MRLEPAGRVGRRRAVDDARRPGAAGALRPGAGGALPLPPAAAAPAAAADGLRHLAADHRAHRRVLPLAAARASSRATPARGCTFVVASTDSAPRRSARSCWSARACSRGSRALVPDRALCHLVPYTTTTLERDLALALGIPMYGADPRLFPLGTKTGCRRLFAEAGVAHPLGAEDLHTVDDVVDALVALRAARPAMRGGDGQAQRGRRPGAGNALVDLRGLPAPGAAGRARRRCARARRGDGARARRTTPLDAYLREARGARRHRRGARRRRRAAQPERAAAGHAARARSSCSRRTTRCSAGRAARATSAAASRPTRPTRGRSRARRRRSASGSRGRACSAGSPSTSSSCATRAGAWTPYAIEINLRKGGTTHPFLTLQFLTDGRYDPATGLFLTAERAREAPRGDRPPRVTERCAGSRSTTCSTSSPAPACTSTRRARPASSST